MFDAVIVGAGLAGSCAASVLARAGLRIAIVDAQAVHTPEFRAEKLGAPHMAQFRRLGLGPVAEAATSPMDDIRVYRFGRLISSENRREYGFSYSSLVNAVRDSLPAAVARHFCRVESVATGPGEQTVTLAGGRVLRGRLLVIATGLGDAVRRKAGIARIEIKKAHSLSLGFTFAKPASAFPFQSLNYFGHHRAGKLGYLTLFPIAGAMRANMFVYHDARDAWTKAFRARPQEILRDMMPEIAGLCDGFALEGNVDVRQIDLTVTDNIRRDGVVLLGDAFCTTCPAPGVGIQRVLTDVEQLCTLHLPRWLASPGMGADKIAQYYDDPVKVANDKRGMQLSVYSRAMVMEEGAVWTARRLRNDAVRRAYLLQVEAVRALRQLPGFAALRPLAPGTRDIMGA